MRPPMELRLTGQREVAQPPLLGRELTPADIEALGLPRPAAPSALKRIRDSHHAVARLVAEGRMGVEISALTGYTSSSISILKNDPAFAELVEFYRAEQRDAFASLADRLALLSLDTVQELQTRLADDPDGFTVKELHEQLKIAADRTGHGPQSRSTVVNVHVGLAERLEEARRRAAEARTINLEAQDTFGTVSAQDTVGMAACQSEGTANAPEE